MAELPEIILPTGQKILDAKFLHFNLYVDLNMIGTLKLIPDDSKYRFNFYNQFECNNSISERVLEIAKNIGLRVIQESMDNLKSTLRLIHNS